MIKVSLFGKNSDSIRHLIPEFNLQIDEDQPDVIISYGGDGTLLSCERKFPGIPKLSIRDSKVCKKCPRHTTEFLLKTLSEGKLNSLVFPKLEAEFDDQKILGLNDIVIRNSTPMHALRFRLLLNQRPASFPELVIGDGVIATTAFGSTGYYQSITRNTIDTDFALAFSNTTEVLGPIKFLEGDEIKIVIVRGPGTLSSDNNPKLFSLKEGDEIKIFPSKHLAKIYAQDSLRCKDCVILRDKRLR